MSTMVLINDDKNRKLCIKGLKLDNVRYLTDGYKNLYGSHVDEVVDNNINRSPTFEGCERSTAGGGGGGGEGAVNYIEFAYFRLYFVDHVTSFLFNVERKTDAMHVYFCLSKVYMSSTNIQPSTLIVQMYIHILRAIVVIRKLPNKYILYILFFFVRIVYINIFEPCYS